MPYRFDNVTVLIIEDNQPMLDLARSVLQTFGIENIITARDGEEGFEVFCLNNPDLVIADWMMEPVDGISLTRRIRNDAASPNPFAPVILMTGFSEKHRVLEARDAGVTEFLVKPFNARDLYLRLAQIIEKPRQFVRTQRFFGPDRRRKRGTDYEGPRRRDTDIRPEDYERAGSAKDREIEGNPET
jgi:CheY-like chemotaxis protein